MKWNTYTITTTTQAEDLVCGMLLELGIDGVEVLDNIQLTDEEKKIQFIDILAELPPDDGRAQVRFYLEADADDKEVLDQVRAGLVEMSAYVDIGAGIITADTTEEEDWINNWKAFFKPFVVDDILIRPTWEKVENEESYPLVIQIDPGTAFGTGLHETTQLCLRQLRKYVNGETKLFDVGCGSGILAILALKLGAGSAMCMDIDPAAVEASVENMVTNGLADAEYEIFCGNLLEGTAAAEHAGFGCYDVIVSNILADVIIPLAGVVGPHMKPGGIWITSGILYTKEEEVKQAMLENGFRIVEVTRQNDWVSITATR